MRKGQILVLFLVMMMFMLGLFALAMNVGEMARERMQVQQAADSAAMAGARVQALNMGFITLWNDRIIYRIGRLLSDLPDPLDWPDIPNEIDHIKKLKNQQDKALNYLSKEVQVASLLMSRANGAMLGFATPNSDYQTTMSLSIERPWWTLGLIYERKGGDIPEQITVGTINRFYEKLIFSDYAFNGHHKRPLVGLGTSKMYYVFEDPRASSIGLGWRLICTTLPGPWWQQRLVPTGEMPDKAQYMIHGLEFLHSLIVDESFGDSLRELEWYAIEKAHGAGVEKLKEMAGKVGYKIDESNLEHDAAARRWAYWMVWLNNDGSLESAYASAKSQITGLKQELIDMMGGGIAGDIVSAILSGNFSQGAKDIEHAIEEEISKEVKKELNSIVNQLENQLIP